MSLDDDAMAALERAEEAERQRQTLRCRLCASSSTHVLWRRWRARDGAIVRRHECRVCLGRFKSIERAA